MRLLNLNKSLYIFTFLFVLIFPLKTEEPIDIWKKDQKIENKNKRTTSTDNEQPKIDIEKKTNSQINDIEISKDIINSIEEKSIYGIVDPEDNNLSLDMWVQSDGKEIKENMYQQMV